MRRNDQQYNFESVNNTILNTRDPTRKLSWVFGRFEIRLEKIAQRRKTPQWALLCFIV